MDPEEQEQFKEAVERNVEREHFLQGPAHPRAATSLLGALASRSR